MKYDANIIKSTTTPPRWQDLVKKYQTPENWRSIWQIANTIIPFFALWYLTYRSLAYSYWLTLLLALPTAGLLVRTFIIQHDCGHGSFFKSQKANDWVGTFCGFITMVPYYQWRHEHAIHHASSGDLNRRGVGDVTTLTIQEYLALSRWKRFYYRFYRHPAVMLLIGPQFVFILTSRFVGPHSGRRERRNVYLTNAVLCATWATLIATLGAKAFFLVWTPVVVISGAAGVWLFYIQHQYENTYWRSNEEWDYVTAAVMGSSFYKLPRLLQWFTGNIGFHHIHHLSPKIPNYKLEQCHQETPLFQEATVLRFWESLPAASLRLWDEEQQKMVSFKHLKTRAAS